MKKQYGCVNVSAKEINESAERTSGGSGAVERALLKVEGENAKILSGTFELPEASESKVASLEVAMRVLGILVNDSLLGHLPSVITGENLGQLMPYFPFSYHRRFGLTYTDRVCPGSVRNGKCPTCEGRVELFQSEAYKSGRITKDDIIKNGGFGSRQVALVIARIFFNDEDLGIRCFWTNLTNEKAANAKHDNFFDLVEQLTTPKKLLASETLPPDYYANGDGARWLIAEYVRATYAEDGDKAPAGEQKRKSPPRPYWKLSKITPAKEIPTVGAAKNIWWPEIGKKDAIEMVDIMGLLNFTPKEELEKASADKIERMLNPPKKQNAPADGGTGASGSVQGMERETLEKPTWEEILAMDIEDLVRYGVAFGGNEDNLRLAGTANVSALRRSVAKLCGVTPKPVGSTGKAQETQSAPVVDESLPF